MAIVKPTYKHDCNECIFLGNFLYSGRWVPKGVTSVDLYFHLSSTFLSTFIARYGNEGHEYMSGFHIDFLVNGNYDDYPIKEAILRAISNRIIQFKIEKGDSYEDTVELQKEYGPTWVE
jgi:hypothetical protein